MTSSCLKIFDKWEVIREPVSQQFLQEEIKYLEEIKLGVEYYQYLIDNVDLSTNSVNSHIMYAIGKTDKIDPNKPVEFTKGNISLADCDLDIPTLFREKVIKYVEDKYGKDKVGNIITFQRMDGKQAIKEVFSILDPVADSFKLANEITRVMVDTSKIQDILEDIKEDNPKYTVIDYCIENIPAVKGYYDDYKDIFDIAIKLGQTIRSTGKHAAGIVIADEMLDNFVPVYKDEDTNRNIVGFEMADAEYVGAVKYDFLGVAAYDKIGMIIDMIANKLEEPNADI